MKSKENLLFVTPVLPSSDINRDIKWFEEKVGFAYNFGDNMYAGLKRDQIYIHLQWHADNDEDPLLGGSVVKFFVRDIHPIYQELVDRGTIGTDKLNLNTPWGTHEFGFYDLNKNAIFFVQDV